MIIFTLLLVEGLLFHFLVGVFVCHLLLKGTAYASISPSWCVMCLSHSECPAHLFMLCPFASRFWHIILDAFDWPITFSDNIFDILASLLVGHLFHGNKKTVWLAILCAFF